MGVRELSAEQLDELKQDMFWGMDDNTELLEKYGCPQEIPNDVVFNTYEGVHFVPDDFCCSCGQD